MSRDSTCGTSLSVSCGVNGCNRVYMQALSSRSVHEAANVFGENIDILSVYVCSHHSHWKLHPPHVAGRGAQQPACPREYEPAPRPGVTVMQQPLSIRLRGYVVNGVQVFALAQGALQGESNFHARCPLLLYIMPFPPQLF